MAIDITTLQERYPYLFQDETDIIVEAIISEAYAELPLETWTDESIRDRAASYICAHKQTLERGEILKQSSALKSIDENEDLLVDLYPTNTNKYNSVMSSYYGLTVYGREFLRLQKRFLGGAAFVA